MNQKVWRRINKLLFFCIPLYKYKISGKSMEPTLQEGDIILVNRLAYVFNKPKSGDIVALEDPRDGKVLIKRIVSAKQSSQKQEEYFVLGDNLEHSRDSREFGMIERSGIVGKVMSLEARSRNQESRD